jgi:tripartite-type tricarboxylate transporter receptor subunit TctC
MLGSETILAATLTLAASTLGSPGAAADDKYPDKPIRAVVGFSAGSAADLASRIIGEKITESWKQPFITENRPGAGGGLAAQSVAKAAPDGYTLLSVSAAHIILPALSPTTLQSPRP